jgi:lysine-specific demethylase 8
MSIPTRTPGTSTARTTLPRQTWQSQEHFYTHHIAENKPALYANAAKQWRSTRLWNAEYLKNILKNGNTTAESVPVVVGVEESTNGNQARHRINMRFQDFITSLHNGACKGYLKQYNLSNSPEMRKDCQPESFFSSWSQFSGECNLWMGSESSGAKTGLHNDDEENLLCQITGRKRVLMIAPEENKHLYVNQLYDSGTECCDVNASTPNFKIHPLFQNVKTIYTVVLEPGDVLYLPKFWYHEVTPVGEVSISINYFCSTAIEMLRYGLIRIVLDYLHRMGFYKSGNCVCCG